MKIKRHKLNCHCKDKINLYQKSIVTISSLERKGATMPFTSVNGNMFSLPDNHG